MRLPDELDEKGLGLPLTYMVIGVSIFVLIIVGIVIVTNRRAEPGGANAADGNAGNNINNTAGSEAGSDGIDDGQGDNPAADGAAERMASSGDDYIDQLYQNNRLKASDLDFWDMYPQADEAALENPDVLPEEPVAQPTPTPDPATDGKHTLVTRRDGTTEWVPIITHLDANEYDPMKFIKKMDRMGYYEGDRKVSFFGVDISQYNGAVTFSGLKGAGADFVMIRLGARGYDSGLVAVDDNFETNINGASAAGLEVGVYFFSQAVSVAEAEEEAAFVAAQLTGRKVTYPVAFDMEYIVNDEARIDNLDKAGRTEIARAFLTAVQAAGYTPMIYGNKEWLIEQIDLSKLTGYDIWLSQSADLPDYPYQFQMWQYAMNGKISGVADVVNFNISFIDYAAR